VTTHTLRTEETTSGLCGKFPDLCDRVTSDEIRSGVFGLISINGVHWQAPTPEFEK
jgi:hypothetical protein